MKTITCPFCAKKSVKSKIAVLPDMKAMDKAIEDHTSMHIPNKNCLIHNRVANALAARVIQAITIDPLKNTGKEALVDA